MNHSRKDFPPRLIDQAIEHPDLFLPQEEAQFIHDVQTMFEQEKRGWLEQNWTRLVSLQAGTNQPSPTVTFSTPRQQSERTASMSDGTLFSTREHIPSKKHLPHLVGLLAAVLVSVVLVSGLLLALNMARNSQTIGTGAQSTTGSQPLVGCHTSQKTILVNKTVTSKGISLTLECLVNQNGATLLYLKQSSRSLGTNTLDLTFSHGQRFIAAQSSVGYIASSSFNGLFVTIPGIVLDRSGSWTLKISTGGNQALRTWAFTFSVPKN